MRRDVQENKHLFVYAGENDPNSLMTPEDNWIFRGVHDLFGHAANGYDFGPRGELNAAIEHAKMFPKEALPALFAETHGQNSWVNFGPNTHLPPSERPFAEQKGFAVPEEHFPPLEFDTVSGLKPGDPGYAQAQLEAAKARDAQNPHLQPGQPFDNAMSRRRVNKYATEVTGEELAPGRTRQKFSREVNAEDLLPGGGSAREVTPQDPELPNPMGSATEVNAEDLTPGGGSATEVGAEDLLPGGGSARDVTPPNATDTDTSAPAFSVRRYAGQPTSTMGPQRPSSAVPAGSALGKLDRSIQWEEPTQPKGSYKQGVTTLIRQMFDNTVDVRHISEQFQKVVGRPLTIAEDAWKLLRLSKGSEAAAEGFRQKYLAPAVKGLDDEGLKNLNMILKANDSIDKQKVLDQRLDQKLITRIAKKQNAPADPLMLKLKQHEPLIQRARTMNTHNFSGQTSEQAQQALGELEQQLGPETWNDLQQRAQQVWDMGHRLIQYKTEHGLVDRKTAADLIRDFPHYSPIRIVEWLTDQAERGAGSGGGATLSVRGNGLAKLTAQGTDKAALPPLDALVSATSQAFALGSRNDAGQAMIRYFKDVPELAELIRPKNKEALAYVESMRGDKLGKRVPGETTFSVFKDGEQLEFYVDKSLKQAFDIAGPNWLDSWPTVIAAPLKASAEMLRAGATGANVLFMLPNAVGDAITYAVRGGGIPTLPQNAYYLAKGYKSSFLKDADYQKMIAAGGGQSGWFGKGDYKTGQIKGYAGAVNTADQLFGALKDLATFKPVEALGQRFEEATRMAEFHRLSAAGKDAQTAALGARDVTIDFARGGMLTKAVNGLVPFFNVGFQAPAQVVRAMKDPETRGRALLGVMTMVVAPTVMTELYNRQFGDLYKDVPQYVKDRGMVFMLPNQPSSPDPETGRPIPRYVSLNMREWSPFAVAVREGMSRMLGDDPRTWSDLAMTMLKNTSPIEPSQGAGGAVADMMPPLAKTAIEMQTNHDFFRDRPIVPDSLKNLPPEQQYTSQTSEVAKQAGRLTGKSPMMLEHGVRSLGGGVASQALAAGDMALKAAGVAETPDRGLARVEKQLAQTGLNPDKQAQLERERDRLLAAQGNQQQLAREKPVIGGLLASAGYREQGGQLETDAGKRNAQALKDAKATPLGQELDRLGVALPDVKPEIEGVYLDRKRAEQYRQRATNYRQALLNSLVQTDTYQQATDVDKERLVKTATARAGDWAAQTVVPGEVKGGREFLGQTIQGDISKAVPTYLRAIEADQELRGMRPRRYLGVNPDDVDEIVADQSQLSSYRSALGTTKGDMLFISRFGAKRYARLKTLKTSPLYDLHVKQTKQQYPEHATIFSPDVESGPMGS
jgi:hypothetical protein